MSSNLKYQCFVCKKGITVGDCSSSNLDPSAVTIYSNIDKDEADQKSQTFFCHFECFRKINNDDSTLYIESLETSGEIEKENKSISENIIAFTDKLYEKGEKLGIWSTLFSQPSGNWQLLRDIISSDAELALQLEKVEEMIYNQLVISWADDYSSSERSQNRIWRVVIVATDGHYEYPTTLLIGLKKDENV